ncbi:hypothetical protein T45_07331 [Streptomyces turgidiscabies]|nr:hypothetical protein T45_07331 [Streptomyces turgidiscabies]
MIRTSRGVRGRGARVSQRGVPRTTAPTRLGCGLGAAWVRLGCAEAGRPAGTPCSCRAPHDPTNSRTATERGGRVRRGTPGCPGSCPWPRHQPRPGRSPARGTRALAGSTRRHARRRAHRARNHHRRRRPDHRAPRGTPRSADHRAPDAQTPARRPRHPGHRPPAHPGPPQHRRPDRGTEGRRHREASRQRTKPPPSQAPREQSGITGMWERGARPEAGAATQEVPEAQAPQAPQGVRAVREPQGVRAVQGVQVARGVQAGPALRATSAPVATLRPTRRSPRPPAHRQVARPSRPPGEPRRPPLGATARPPPRAPAPRRRSRTRPARPPAPRLAARAAPPPHASHAVRQRAGLLASSRGKTLPGGDTTTNVMDQRGAGRGGADPRTALPRSRKPPVTDAPSCPFCRPKPPS